MSAEPNETSTEEQDAIAPLVLPPGSDTNLFASVDFAHLSGERLLVYGWIFGSADRVVSAFIHIGDIAIDLASDYTRIRRPDVSQHFSSESSDEHGFYALVDLQHPILNDDYLRLSITSLHGQTYESDWPFQRHGQLLGSIPQADLATLQNLLPSLPALDMMRLERLLSEGSNSGLGGEVLATLPPPVEFEIDFCCVLDERILVVYGWFLDPAHDLISVQLGIGNRVIDLLKTSTFIPRLDVNPESTANNGRRYYRPPGFILVEVIPPTHAGANEVMVAITTQGGNSVNLTRPLLRNVHESRTQFLALLSKMDAESAMVLIERIISVMLDLPGMQSLRNLLDVSHDRAAERLPESIHHTNQLSRYSIHIDHAISIAERGLFLAGWFYAENTRTSSVVCHCGEVSFAISKNWIRHTRADVTTYLQAEGINPNDHEHGFTCYVPAQSGDSPYWLQVFSEFGEERRMRVSKIEKRPSSLQTVRRLLSTFQCEHRELRALMDRQIGPAVMATWRARKRPLVRETVEQFGAEVASPEVSVIVPLYGRWDFAEFQMSQFANDATFQDVDLIYVVDDPSIYAEFRNAAPNLFGIYRIPFTIAFSGTNQGFAGANNFGARYARGRFLLLVNSDVMPKKPGWIRELLRIYGTLELPGLLGVKLIYEDGTLQHAGIEFRRHAPWGDLWINDHPLKGQMLMDLKGTREVDAVTAACVLIDAELFRKLKGFSEDYIIGDFEDSDLCLRARRAGYRNYVSLDVELYHLERQSQNQTGDAIWRSNLTAYNCWLHNERWSDLLEEIVSDRTLPLRARV